MKTIVFYVIFVIIEKDGIKNWRHKIMKKRKILAMLMVAALSAGMLAGCGSDDTKEESKSTEADTKENTLKKQKRKVQRKVLTSQKERRKKFPALQTVPGMEKVQMRQQTIPALFWILQSLLPVFIMQRLR